MAMTATVEDFIRLTREDLSEEERSTIQMLLDQAARQITSYLGTSQWATPDPITGLVDEDSIAKDRQLHMVKRYWDNPTGVISESYDGVSVSMDDRSYEGLRLTPYDKQVLNQTRKRVSKINHRWISRNNGSVW